MAYRVMRALGRLTLWTFWLVLWACLLARAVEVWR